MCETHTRASATEAGDQTKTQEVNDGTLAPHVTRPATFRCFGCGEQGHRQSACPKAGRRGLFVEEEPVYDDYREEPETQIRDEQVEGDVGTVLVLHRNYLMPQVIEESWLRSNIFHSSCTIRGKVCRFIIDSGSCTNDVSEEAVHKLALFTEPHPSPYKLVWLNTKTELRISKRCRVPFSVGSSYKDLLCCDVLPMDAGHLLLGRPWQYDRRTTHDGFANTYSFLYEDKRITLLPSQDATPPVVKSTPSPAHTSPSIEKPIMFLSKSQLPEALRSIDMLCAVVTTPSSSSFTYEVPPTFRDLVI